MTGPQNGFFNFPFFLDSVNPQRILDSAQKAGLLLAPNPDSFILLITQLSLS